MQIYKGMIAGSVDHCRRYPDDSSTGRAASGLTVASAEGHAPMGGNVVSHNWDGMKLQLRDVAVELEKGWKRMTC